MALKTFIKKSTANGKTYEYEKPVLYRTWGNMKTRCDNPNATYFDNYGGRGISYCSEWSDYSEFEKWAINNGYDDGLELDRIDNNLGYNPDNCRFVDSVEQSRNRRCVKRYTKDGFTGTLRQWAERLGVNRSTLAQRYYCLGWEIDKVLTN